MTTVLLPMLLRPYTRDDLPGVLGLCEAEGWPSFAEEPNRAHQVLTAPGIVTVVAVDGEALLGFAQLQSDGEIQAHLSVIAVDRQARRRGVARALIEAALKAAGGPGRIDLVTDSAREFYAAMPNVRMTGFRLYPFYSGPHREQPGVMWKDGRKETG
jgi:ribosomal protein S18 acetylase RimI-like enzyme